MLKHHRLAYQIIQRNRKELSKSFKNTQRKSMTTVSPFPKWPKAVHDTTGDYRKEAAFLESTLHSKKDNSSTPNLYQYQNEVPHLPLPAVPDTLKKLVPTALPLWKESNPSEKSSFLQAVKDFPAQVAKLQLQERLAERRNNEYSNSSWLQHWWNTLAYLKVRDPVVINVSYFYHFHSDPTLPALEIENDLSIPRGAMILYKLAQIRLQVCSATLPPPSIGRKKPIYLCNAQYKYAFHTCRIPQLEQDLVRMYDPSRAEHSHCIVSYRGYFYAMDFINPETGEPLPMKLLEQRLKRVKDLVKEQQQHKDNVELGWLTSWDRDSWTKARELLIETAGKDMEQALEKLQSGAFVLCLDDEVCQ